MRIAGGIVGSSDEGIIAARKSAELLNQKISGGNEREQLRRQMDVSMIISNSAPGVPPVVEAAMAEREFKQSLAMNGQSAGTRTAGTAALNDAVQASGQLGYGNAVPSLALPKLQTTTASAPQQTARSQIAQFSSSALAPVSKDKSSAAATISEQPKPVTEQFAFRNVDAKTVSDPGAREGIANVRFRRNLGLEKAEAQKTLNPSAALLVDFEMQRTGSEVRVVDGDGSVYSGQVLNEPVQSGNRAGGSPPKPVPAKEAETSDKLSRGVTVNGRSAVELRFLVTGTNQTLHQQVVFEGSLVNDLPMAEDRPAIASAEKAKLAEARQEANVFPGRAGSATTVEMLKLTSSQVTNSFSNRRIIGTARLNRTNTILIQAIQAPR